MLKDNSNNYLLKNLKQSEKDRKNGDYYFFDNHKKAVAFLDNIIDGKRYEN